MRQGDSARQHKERGEQTERGIEGKEETRPSFCIQGGGVDR